MTAQKIVFLLGFIGGLSWVTYAQNKQLTVENTGSFERVDLNIIAKTGNCSFRPTQSPDILNTYSNLEKEEYQHALTTEIQGGKYLIELDLDENGDSGLGKKISDQVWGPRDKRPGKYWRFYLTDSKPYSINFQNGLGNTSMDLSGLAVENLKINTGSSNVHIFYSSGLKNKVAMDTFLVRVDVGSLVARQLHLSRSKVIITDVGFGNTTLDFSERSDVSQFVRGSLGAGDLIILLPGNDAPVLVKIRDSWLCNVMPSKSLKKIDDNTFATASYSPDAQNALTFDLDVSMGKIVFKERE